MAFAPGIAFAAFVLVSFWSLNASSRAHSAPFQYGLNPIAYTKTGPTAQDLDDMKALGANAVRLWANWRSIEAKKGRYEFAALDANITDAIGRGLTPFLLVAGSPRHACPVRAFPEAEDSLCPPRLEPYRAFLQQLVTRYKGRIKLYQIWNEPNLDYYWLPKPDAAAYARLLRVSYETIKENDPQATVVFGGLAGVDLEYADRVLNALRGKRAFDGMAVHPYRFSEGFINKHGPFDKKPFARPNGGSEATLKEELLDFMGVFTRHGYGRSDLYLTEMGWGAHRDKNDGLNVTLAEQASFLRELYRLVTTDPQLSLVKGIFWFCDRDWAKQPGEPHAEEFGFYGLLRIDRKWKPAASAFKEVATQGKAR